MLPIVLSIAAMEREGINACEEKEGKSICEIVRQDDKGKKKEMVEEKEEPSRAKQRR